jgi:ATPase subunit of ABC transporter with duplicated ATPase domains
VFEAVVSGMGDVAALLADYHEVSHQLAEEDADHEALLARLHTLQTELEAVGAWEYEAQAERVIQRFSLDPDARVGSLSGGQKKRLALAQALAVSPDVLLLDEPTNHLDIAAIEWLENLLIESGVTLLFITHDRRFLDRVATRIVELDRGKLQFSRQLQPSIRSARSRCCTTKKSWQCKIRQGAGAGRGVDSQGRRKPGERATKVGCCALSSCGASVQARRERRARSNWRSIPATRAASWSPSCST